jgi:hypothetical protein
MADFSEDFDSTKRYRGLGYQDGQFVVADEFNRVQDIQNWDSENKALYMAGYQLKVDHNTNTPILKVRANNDLGDGQVITVQAIDATHVKWRKNSGSWSSSIAVTADDETWNTVGTSGLDIIFNSSMAASDESEVWVAQAMRLLGGELEHTGGTTYKLNAGKWLILGRHVVLSDDSAVCNDGDYVYIKVEEDAVDKSTDATLGIFLGDGNYADKSPYALQRTYALQSSASFPNSTDDPYVQYVLVGKVTSASGGIFDQMWASAIDVQQIMRLYADTEAPITPTGLSLTSGAESDLITLTTSHAISTPIPLGYLTVECSANPEPDVDYYEFKVVRLDAVGNPTSDSQTIPVHPNTDAGGVSIPTGISHTVHNLTMGVEYRVWVRAVDYAGNVSDWSSSVDETIGGDCQIPVGDSGPSFTLIDTSGYVGFTLEVSSLPSNANGYSVWVGEGSIPTPSSNEGLIGHFPANQAQVKIPWPEGGHPYVVLQAYDASGQYHLDAGGSVVSTNDNVELAESAELAVGGHDVNPSSHGGLIGDLNEVVARYGSMAKFSALIESQGFAIENTYIVAEDGGYYASIAGALSSIDNDSPDQALILVAPGEYDSGTTITIPDFGIPVEIVGLGGDTCIIAGDWNLSDVDMRVPPRSGPTLRHAGLTLRNLTLTGFFSGTKSSSDFGAVLFDSCVVTDAPSSRSLVAFDAGASGKWYFYAMNTVFNMYSSSGQYEIALDNEVHIHFEDCVIRNQEDDTLVYFTSPSGRRVVKNCAFMVDSASSAKTLDSDTASTTVYMVASSYNIAMGTNIDLEEGDTSTNTLFSGDYLIE